MNRLRPFMKKIISPFQSSFIPERGTTDNILLMQEVLNKMRVMTGKKGYMGFKIDLTKAYGKVYWDFLRATLVDFHFSPLIVELIMFCVTFTSTAVAWNECIGDYYQPHRGLR